MNKSCPSCGSPIKRKTTTKKTCPPHFELIQEVDSLQNTSAKKKICENNNSDVSARGMSIEERLNPTSATEEPKKKRGSPSTKSLGLTSSKPAAPEKKKIVNEMTNILDKDDNASQVRELLDEFEDIEESVSKTAQKNTAKRSSTGLDVLNSGDLQDKLAEISDILREWQDNDPSSYSLLGEKEVGRDVYELDNGKSDSDTSKEKSNNSEKPKGKDGRKPNQSKKDRSSNIREGLPNLDSVESVSNTSKANKKHKVPGEGEEQALINAPKRARFHKESVNVDPAGPNEVFCTDLIFKELTDYDTIKVTPTMKIGVGMSTMGTNTFRLRLNAGQTYEERCSENGTVVGIVLKGHGALLDNSQEVEKLPKNVNTTFVVKKGSLYGFVNKSKSRTMEVFIVTHESR